MPPGGGGATQLSFVKGSSARRSKPFPFNILIFTKMVPLSYPKSKIAPLSHTSRISQNNRISYNCHVFPGFSVVLSQLHSHLCQNVAPFDILRFSHYFLYFEADFVTLSYTKMSIFSTLLCSVSLKKGIPFGWTLPM